MVNLVNNQSFQALGNDSDLISILFQNFLDPCQPFFMFTLHNFKIIFLQKLKGRGLLFGLFALKNLWQILEMGLCNS